MFFTLKEMAEKANVSKATLKKAVDDGELIPVQFGANDGVTKVTVLEYNRWAISKQYKNHPELMRSAMNCLELKIPVSVAG